MARHIFVSYSRADEAYVERLVDSMRAAGLDVWVDRELSQADRWLATIRERIDTCGALVLVMTPAAEKSEMVEAEVLYARDAGKEVYALLLDGTPFWYLRNRQYESVIGGRIPGSDWMSRLAPANVPTQRAAPTAAQADTRSPRSGQTSTGRRGTLAEQVKAVVFAEPPIGKRGYDEEEVDNFLDKIVAALESGWMSPVEVHDVAFKKPPVGEPGYDEEEVDDFLDLVERELTVIAVEEEQTTNG